MLQLHTFHKSTPPCLIPLLSGAYPIPGQKERCRGGNITEGHLGRLFWAGVEILDEFVVLDRVRYDGEVWLDSCGATVLVKI